MLPLIHRKTVGLKLFLSAAICLVFIFWVQFAIGWREIFLSWTELTKGGLTVAIGLFATSYLFRALRIYDYFRADLRPHFAATFRLAVLHVFFNNFLPFRSGELAFPVLLKSHFGLPVERSLAALVWLRFLDLHFLLIVGGLLLLAPNDFPTAGVCGWLALAATPIILYLGQTKLAALLVNGNGATSKTARKLFSGLPDGGSAFVRSWLWTALNWIVKLVVLAALLREFANVPVPVALLGSLSGELSASLPIQGFAAIGTYESGVLFGLVPAGVNLELAAAAAVNLHLFTLGMSVVGALLVQMISTPQRKANGERRKAKTKMGEVEAI